MIQGYHLLIKGQMGKTLDLATEFLHQRLQNSLLGSSEAILNQEYPDRIQHRGNLQLHARLHPPAGDQAVRQQLPDQVRFPGVLLRPGRYPPGPVDQVDLQSRAAVPVNQADAEAFSERMKGGQNENNL